MKRIKNVFLSAINQNAGKTTISLGLYKILKDKGFKAAFMKPVGQKYVVVNHQQVDKDSYLIGEIYHCWQKFKEMSPVTVGKGFTEKYIFHPRKDVLRQQILKSFENLSYKKDIMIIEGTGHAGVGSVFDFSNADVAQLLGSKVIIVSEGGIGRSIDEIMLNKALFDLKGVEILGVIVNKVLPDKYDRIKHNVAQGLKNKGIRLLGVLPLQPLLSFPTVEQIRYELKLKLICGKTYLSRRVENTIVAAMEPHNMISYLRDQTLIITSGDRLDNIIAAVNSKAVKGRKKIGISGMVLTGGLFPGWEVVNLLKRSKIPVLLSEEDTYTTAAKIKSITCKIEKTDKDKIAEATRLVKRYVDIDLILKNL
ncbi:MAG: AAA family ATPase [Candidatus Omnitrophota bacterium]